MNGAADDSHIRELRYLDELTQTRALALAVWGEADSAEHPTLLRVAQKTGGLVAGAFGPQGQLRAYLVSLPTSRANMQHSHRLGVHPHYRRQGLGERLKRFQRTWCLERGITHVRWTFDPLLLTNAHLNVRRLGATVKTYLVDEYGELAGINAGAPSDRLEAEWQLDSARVVAHLQGEVREAWPESRQVRGAGHAADAVTLPVPQDYTRLLREDPPRALAWRLRTREQLTDLFARGYVLVDVDRERQQYLLRRGGPC